jgi:putative flippase GtrA
MIIKYIFSGGLATAVNLIALYFFTEVMGWWYLYSAVASFLVAFCVGFTMQKFWTFNGDHERRGRWQLAMYLILNLFNLGLNSLGLFLLVEKTGLWYIFAQIIMSGSIAISSFIIYRKVIFKPKFSSI